MVLGNEKYKVCNQFLAHVSRCKTTQEAHIKIIDKEKILISIEPSEDDPLQKFSILFSFKRSPKGSTDQCVVDMESEVTFKSSVYSMLAGDSFQTIQKEIISNIEKRAKALRSRKWNIVLIKFFEDPCHSSIIHFPLDHLNFSFLCGGHPQRRRLPNPKHYVAQMILITIQKSQVAPTFPQKRTTL